VPRLAQGNLLQGSPGNKAISPRAAPDKSEKHLFPAKWRDNVAGMRSGAAGHKWSAIARAGDRWERIAVATAALLILVGPAWARDANATALPSSTISYYEHSASPGALYRQGTAAGRAGAQGIVILDFGRPADNGIASGTLAYNGAFIPFAAIAKGMEFYIAAYYRHAPPYTTLNVALGTNDSCGTSQPCGAVVACGCPDEPSDFSTWGGELAATVEAVDAWVTQYRAEHGYTDVVRVIAADDAEPAYDPGYQNTYDVLAGYAAAVGGPFPTMVDYGSADPDFWTEAELLQVAYGFRPDVPMPQIYYPDQAAQWAQLLRYAKASRGAVLDIYGVLTTGAGTNSPAAAYADMLGAASEVTNQSSIPWLSTIRLI